LVITVTILALLAVIAIGMLGLSTVVVRSANKGQAMTEAQANARLALVIAMGELQKQLGPDQRVSATATLLDGNQSTPDTYEGVDQPHWVGVWRTTKSDGSSFLKRDSNFGGLSDDRRNSDWSKESQLLTYLVSGNEGKSFGESDFQDPLGASLTEDDSIGGAVELVSADDDDPTRQVLVQRTGVTTNRAGSYGYWIRDLGTAAKITTPDRYEGIPANPSSPDDGGFFRLMATQGIDPEAVLPGAAIDSTETQKIADWPQLALVAGVDPADIRNSWHDYTTVGHGVLSSVTTGKLKRDLTDYLNQSGNPGAISIPSLKDGGSIISAGIDDEDHLVGIPNEDTAAWLDLGNWETQQRLHERTGPRFGTLRQWARLADRVEFQNGDSTQILAKGEPNPNHATGPFDGTNQKPLAVNDVTTHGLQPVLVEGTTYYNISSFPKTDERNQAVHRMRMHLYPVVTLWNPHNLELKVRPMLLMLHLPDNKRLRVRSAGGFRHVNTSLGDTGVHSGSLYFGLEGVTMAPGECLVFSPTTSSKYSKTNMILNRLSPAQSPDPARCFYLDGAEVFGGGLVSDRGKTYNAYDFPNRPVLWKQDVGALGAHDVRMLLKDYRRSSLGGSVSVGAFRSNYWMMQAVSGSPKLGATREQPIVWSSRNEARMEETQEANTILNQIPDNRTRESIRLRWQQEHSSNTGSSGLPERFFQSASLVNWNIRAGFALKNPFDNTAPVEPFFHGVYTRDTPGPEVGWDNMMPSMIGGLAHGNPFGPHQLALPRYVLFDVPRQETGVLSLGFLQHAKLSEFVWHAGYPIGNSFADPRMERTSTAPEFEGQHRGWNRDAYGQAGNDPHADYIAQFARGWSQHSCSEENLVYDLSFEVNKTLWDDYFLSSGNSTDRQSFLADPIANPLPNGRMTLVQSGSADLEEEDLDFHHAARNLMVDGAFNVNSTSIKAWTALLSCTRHSGMGEHPFPRFYDPPDDAHHLGDDPLGDTAVAGFRDLSEEEIEALAEEIVVQVKRRGPFLSLADFVNRRLIDGEDGLLGTLQAAIEEAGLNDDFKDGDLDIDHTPLPDSGVPFLRISDAINLQQEDKAPSRAAGLPGYLLQGDLLQAIGPALSARSDTFMIRTYGDARDGSGKVTARAWCEAVVQRFPDPLHPESESEPLNPDRSDPNAVDFGRRFRLVSFRWLASDEI
jgi:hypothetical protein